MLFYCFDDIRSALDPRAVRQITEMTTASPLLGMSFLGRLRSFTK
jgi:predicted aspartyl protease